MGTIGPAIAAPAPSGPCAHAPRAPLVSPPSPPSSRRSSVSSLPPPPLLTPDTEQPPHLLTMAANTEAGVGLGLTNAKQSARQRPHPTLPAGSLASSGCVGPLALESADSPGNANALLGTRDSDEGLDPDAPRAPAPTLTPFRFDTFHTAQLTSTPTAELGPFEYPIPDNTAVASRRSASTSTSPSSGALSGGPGRLFPSPVISHMPPSAPAPAVPLFHARPAPIGRRGSIASGQISRLARGLPGPPGGGGGGSTSQKGAQESPPRALALATCSTAAPPAASAPASASPSPSSSTSTVPIALVVNPPTSPVLSTPRSPRSPVTAIGTRTRHSHSHSYSWASSPPAGAPTPLALDRADRPARARRPTSSNNIKTVKAPTPPTRARPLPGSNSPTLGPINGGPVYLPPLQHRPAAIAFAHNPLPAPIPPSLLARRGSSSPAAASLLGLQPPSGGWATAPYTPTTSSRLLGHPPPRRSSGRGDNPAMPIANPLQRIKSENGTPDESALDSSDTSPASEDPPQTRTCDGIADQQRPPQA